jgi:hypothetical protein
VPKEKPVPGGGNVREGLVMVSGGLLMHEREGRPRPRFFVGPYEVKERASSRMTARGKGEV